ncbi:MAG: RlmE family RNA methyltransferase [Candidatus Hadarchaeota archaeon]|nr:RlmE family RNA methyltransferase [Candidatus Hadarchaeota archaeon]
MGKRWQRERKHEHFYRMAKRAGYRSRSAYKLKQLDGRYKLLRPGNVVVDLGAAPGGWLQVARERVGSGGFVIGVDLQPIEKMPYENVDTIVADITDPDTWECIRDNLPKPASVVISDASPKISGIWDVDHAKSVELAKASLNLSSKILRPGGRMLIKVFQGELFDDFVGDVQRKFSFVKVSKPKASRKRSAEAYIIAKKFKGTVRPNL